MEMSTLEGIFARVAKEAPNMDSDQIDRLITELAFAINPNTTNAEIKQVAAQYSVKLNDGPAKDSSGSAFLAMALCALVQAKLDDHSPAASHESYDADDASDADNQADDADDADNQASDADDADNQASDADNQADDADDQAGGAEDDQADDAEGYADDDQANDEDYEGHADDADDDQAEVVDTAINSLLGSRTVEDLRHALDSIPPPLTEDGVVFTLVERYRTNVDDNNGANDDNNAANDNNAAAADDDDDDEEGEDLVAAEPPLQRLRIEFDAEVFLTDLKPLCVAINNGVAAPAPAPPAAAANVQTYLRDTQAVIGDVMTPRNDFRILLATGSYIRPASRLPAFP